MKPYRVKEVFRTLQGEGFHTGRCAVFVRFAGCNLWSGREEDRRGGCSAWCDTEFRGGVGMSLLGLMTAIESEWPDEGCQRFVVLTGGEPSLQLDTRLLRTLEHRGFEAAVETNGTTQADLRPAWVTVSPKPGAPLVRTQGDELKLVYPQPEPEMAPERFSGLKFAHFFLQPLDGPEREQNIRAAADYCLAHPQWRLSLQTHKIVGLR